MYKPAASALTLDAALKAGKVYPGRSIKTVKSKQEKVSKA